MTGGRSGILTIVVVGLVLAIGIGASWAFSKLQLPDPEQADSRQLLRWLVTRDLEDQPVEFRRRLAVRLEEEFGKADVSLGRLGGELGAEHYRQVVNNLQLLLEPWLDEKVDRFSALPGRQQPAYVDSVLDVLDRWRTIAAAAIALPAAAGATGNQGVDSLLLTRIHRWQEHAPPQRRAQIDHFLSMLQVRWLWRQFSGSR